MTDIRAAGRYDGDADALAFNAMKAELRRLAAENERLTRERGEALHSRDAHIVGTRQAEIHAEAAKARVAELEAALQEYLYETTHLATPETVDGFLYRKTLIKYSAIQKVRAALKGADDAK